jgi:ribosome maturation factor RimP
MIDVKKVRQALASLLEGNDFFLVDVTTGKGDIQVFVDRPSGITIDDCTLLANRLRKMIGEEMDEYDLTVSSPGLDMPLKVPEQYMKNTGREVEVITTDGRMMRGMLHAADREGFVLLENRKAGKKEIQVVEHHLRFHQVKKVLVIVKFK